MFINSTSGRVGIGTENPNETLEVAGNATIQGDLKVEGRINKIKIIKNESEPTSPEEGDIWYDTANHQLKYWDGSEWKIAAKGFTKSKDVSIFLCRG